MLLKAQDIVEWVFFSLVSLLPLALAIVMLFLAPERDDRALHASRDWLLRNGPKVAAVTVFLLVASLLRNGIASLTN